MCCSCQLAHGLNCNFWGVSVCPGVTALRWQSLGGVVKKSIANKLCILYFVLLVGSRATAWHLGRQMIAIAASVYVS